MHRKSKTNLSFFRRMQVKFGLFQYCGCNYCTTYGGSWRNNHSEQKYVTPTFLRPFDGVRHYSVMTAAFILFLWNLSKEGAAGGKN
jgi:hypothetical protein